MTDEIKVTLTMTRDEYRTLLLGQEIADWILTANKLEEEKDETTKPFEDLFARIRGLAKDADCADLVIHDEAKERYDEADELIEMATDLIDNYTSENFWDDLANNLADRDLLRRFGKVGIKRMNNEERFTRFYQIHDRYMEEFEEHGLARIEIREAPPEKE